MTKKWIIMFVLSFIICCLFTGCNKNNEKEVDWENIYHNVIEEWQSDHGDDYQYGYDYIYLDDNDVPELCLHGSDTAYYCFDLYTIVDGEAKRMELYKMDGEQFSEGEYTRSGAQGAEDFYFERTGIIFFSWGMIGDVYRSGFVMNGNKLEMVIRFVHTNSIEVDGSQNTYILKYLKKDGTLCSVHKVSNTDIFECEEREELEKEWGFSFDNKTYIRPPR